ncbi:MAG: response regulator transcription factor [Lachnospiraceae bacterium]|jgi:DNA-binding response OmpR family regulator|nr:response regulator transcription factor [Lachnospiraceae bacterium]
MNDIYYVEDDESISQTVKEFLGQHGYSVFVYTTIEAAKKAFGSACPMLALLDWNMPDGSGRELSRWIRSKWKELPVILLTVRGDSRDIVSGFQSGADDYVVKPFELEVLLLRIEALLRRCGDVSRQYLSCGGISLDQKRMLVFSEGNEVDLSPSEYQLLLYLLQNKGIIVTRKQLLERVWDNSGNFVNDNTLTVAMKRLREKLHKPECLKTVRSIGYRMEEQR